MSGTTTGSAKSEAELVIRAQHTPTPWSSLNGYICGEHANIPQLAQRIAAIVTTNGDTENSSANASFIVRAVNAHQALFDELKAINDAWCGPSMEPDEFFEFMASRAHGIRAALSKAGAGQ